MSDRLHVLQRQPRRISITLSYHVHEALLNRSEEEGRSVSNLCAFLLEETLRHEGFLLSSATQRHPFSKPNTGNGHQIMPTRMQANDPLSRKPKR